MLLLGQPDKGAYDALLGHFQVNEAIFVQDKLDLSSGLCALRVTP